MRGISENLSQSKIIEIIVIYFFFLNIKYLIGVDY